MAEEPGKDKDLENIVEDESSRSIKNRDENAVPKEEKESLEEITKRGFLASLSKLSGWDIAKLGGTALLGAAFGGGLLNLATTTGSFVLSHYITDRKNMSRKSLKSETYLGNFMTIPLWEMYKQLAKIDNVWLKWLAWAGIGVPAMQIFLAGSKYLINKYVDEPVKKLLNPIELVKTPFQTVKYVKDNIFKLTKEALLYLSVPVWLNLKYVPLKYNVPAMAAIRTLWRYVSEKALKKSKEQAEQKQHSAASNYPGLAPRTAPAYKPG